MAAAGEGKQLVYHERQRLQFCLLHALNSLLQGENLFSRAELDHVADQLQTDGSSSFIWPLSFVLKRHRNIFTGDYDVNVLIAALAARGKDVVWFDRRKGSVGLDLASYESTLVGLIVNLSITRFGGIWKGRHWVAIKHIKGTWYNLDSDLVNPMPFASADDMKDFLDNCFAKNGEVFLVLAKSGD